jgi:hypothetical protein
MHARHLASLLGAGEPANLAAESKRTKRIKTKRCRPQVDQCVASLTAACTGDVVCLRNLICCDLFADCDAEAAVLCIFANSN